MPELHLCTYCDKPIYEETEQYVILNKDAFEQDRKYAHASCHKKKGEGQAAAASQK